MNDPAGPLVALPIGAALVALTFAVHLFVRAGRRRSWFEAVWGVALLMFATASAALALGVLDGWSSAEFRVYWLFGAVLNVPYLALGEVYLLARRPWIGHAALIVVLALTAWAAAEVRTAPLNEEVLATETFFTGREVLGEDAPARVMAMILCTPAPRSWCWGSCGRRWGCGIARRPAAVCTACCGSPSAPWSCSAARCSLVRGTSRGSRSPSPPA